jgi:hypothetical protein
LDRFSGCRPRRLIRLIGQAPTSDRPGACAGRITRLIGQAPAPGNSGCLNHSDLQRPRERAAPIFPDRAFLVRSLTRDSCATLCASAPIHRPRPAQSPLQTPSGDPKHSFRRSPIGMPFATSALRQALPDRTAPTTPPRQTPDHSAPPVPIAPYRHDSLKRQIRRTYQHIGPWPLRSLPTVHHKFVPTVTGGSARSRRTEDGGERKANGRDAKVRRACQPSRRAR